MVFHPTLYTGLIGQYNPDFKVFLQQPAILKILQIINYSKKVFVAGITVFCYKFVVLLYNGKLNLKNNFVQISII